MALPNMAMIPSGYKPTKLYSVLPTESLGSEEVLNGDFSNGSTDWTLQTGWSVVSGYANCDNSGTGSRNLRQNSIVEVGKTYEVKFDLNVTSGTLYIIFGGTTGLTESKSYTLIRTSSGTDLQFRNSTGNFIGTIDNISVKEVLVGDADFDVLRETLATRVNQQGLIEIPEFISSNELITNGDFATNSNWTKDTGWSISGGSLNFNGTSSNNSRQVIAGYSVSKLYEVTYTISVISGGAYVSLGYAALTTRTSSGTYKERGSFANGGAFNGFLRIFSTGTSEFSISNISIVEVVRNNIPRLDYTDGTCPVLLTEPQSTNLAIYSNDFSKWAKLSSLSTVTLNSIISPDGTVNGVKQTQIVANNSARLRLNPVVVAGKKYTFSIYAKKGNHNKLIMNISGINTIFTLTDDWARYEITETATGTFVDAGISQGVVNDFIYMYGAQVEELDYSTSYIPTSGATFTRNQDIVNNAGTSATYNSTEGVLFVEVAGLIDGEVNRNISINDGTSSNQVSIYLNSAAGKITALISSNNVDAYLDSIGHNQLDFNKIALSYKNNDINLWINGVEAATNITQNAPIGLSSMRFANGGDGSPFYGKTSQIQVFNTVLSDFDLQNLTSNATAYATYETMRTSLNFNIQ